MYIPGSSISALAVFGQAHIFNLLALGVLLMRAEPLLLAEVASEASIGPKIKGGLPRKIDQSPNNSFLAVPHGSL